ncbi:MAG: aromatic ring-hydroxylating dioxygenase subunit alpha [Gammaproteobacteria bacterium]|nr:aromatic ring-hydroxylating dioxygenase subunit alpha [Gammaproteobacteria bacterium]
MASSPSRPIARSSTASAQELVHRDGRPVPPVFEQESARFLGDEDIAFSRYTSQDFFDLEMQRMWTRTWQWACREEHVKEVGDYYVYEIGRHSVLIVRDEDKNIRAYVNSCLHRGTKFRPGGSQGCFAEISCPFHGWTWSLDGQLQRVPYDWDAPHVAERDFSLPSVAVGLWGGFVFINLDPDAPPLDDYLAPIPEHFENFDIAGRFVELHIEKELACNWKSAKEAFIENYHTQKTHPQLLYGSDDEGTQYDVFNDNVCRFFCAFGVSSPSIDPAPSEQELVDMMLVGDRAVIGDEVVVGPGESARIVMARVLRRELGEKYETDLSRYTDTEMIDVSQYGLFPNMILFPQLSLPMVYRFRPIGNDPNRTLFELLILRPVPDEGSPPRPATPIRLTEPESFTTVDGFDVTLGEVYDQDTGNLRAQQEGFHAARKPGETLLNYQEVRVRLLHQTLDRYLGVGEAD